MTFNENKNVESLLALRQITHTSNPIPDAVVDFNNLACAGSSMTYLHLVVDMSLDRDCVRR